MIEFEHLMFLENLAVMIKLKWLHKKTPLKANLKLPDKKSQNTFKLEKNQIELQVQKKVHYPTISQENSQKTNHKKRAILCWLNRSSIKMQRVKIEKKISGKKWKFKIKSEIVSQENCFLCCFWLDRGNLFIIIVKIKMEIMI
jgi:hypothetical protein